MLLMATILGSTDNKTFASSREVLLSSSDHVDLEPTDHVDLPGQAKQSQKVPSKTITGNTIR